MPRLSHLTTCSLLPAIHATLLPYPAWILYTELACSSSNAARKAKMLSEHFRSIRFKEPIENVFAVLFIEAHWEKKMDIRLNL